SDSGSGHASEGRVCPSPITVVRRMADGRERVRMPLLDCDGAVRDEARRALSILARPRQLGEAPTESQIQAWQDADGDPAYLAEGVRLLHPGLLERLQRIGETFAGYPLEIVSGYRPHSPSSSRHHHARALDLRVPGVPRQRVRDLAVTFPQTGVGWYPNSVFVHVDVRQRDAYWVDLSGPGEAPRYVRGAEAPPVAEPPSAPPAPNIDDALDTLTRALRVTLPGEEPPELDEAVEPPEDVPPPTEEELEQIRRETDAWLERIRIDP
ncbi:MAG TPA: DUF882 domain-containing protein, partial [Sandaracinaceae bacterium LLY-WYZ-13_1]|nr:DUF882 domain-containing protein [Sandaracinaceae bacterium LLY-WYZ-13_1]